MSTEHDAQDDALDKVLAAMRDAVPPEGMEARIATRLRQHATAPPAAPFRWRDVFANPALTGVWWQGAIAGAAAMFLITGTFLLVGHLLQTHPSRMTIASNSTADRHVTPVATPFANSSYSTPASETRAQLCAHPTMLRAATIVPASAIDSLRAETLLESDAPSRPAPELPLTAQERALVRLAQTSTPSQLAAINPVEYANLEAQSALKFQKSFASPVPPPAPDSNTATTSIVSSEPSSEDNPKPDSAASPEVNSQPEIIEEKPSPTKEEE